MAPMGRCAKLIAVEDKAVTEYFSAVRQMGLPCIVSGT